MDDDKILKTTIKKEKSFSILDSKNDECKPSNSFVDPSVFAISNETDDIIILENTESIINIKDDDENSVDLIEKISNNKYCEDGLTPFPALQKKTIEATRSGYLCAECERVIIIIHI